jgi:hypothetical protein
MLTDVTWIGTCQRKADGTGSAEMLSSLSSNTSPMRAPTSETGIIE